MTYEDDLMEFNVEGDLIQITTKNGGVPIEHFRKFFIDRIYLPWKNRSVRDPATYRANPPPQPCIA